MKRIVLKSETDWEGWRQATRALVLEGIEPETVVWSVGKEAPPLAEESGSFLAQAAVRRTPVLLDGVVIGAAGLVAERLAPGASQWWLAAHRSVEPAHALALEHLGLKPVVELQMRLGEGSGALTVLPLVTTAVRILAEMATFEEARVSDRDAPVASA